MREESWYKWLFIAMLLHVLIIGAFSIPMRAGRRSIDLSSYYSVNLVGDIGSGAQKPVAAPPQPKVETNKAKALPQTHPPSTTKERTLTPVKKQGPQPTTKDDVRWLDKRIREMRKQYMDVSSGAGRGQGSSGLPSSGGSVPLDPALEKYYGDVWEMIRNAWHTPLSAKKELQTLVTITIRKDGLITDWQIDQRSGNRAYDEAVARAIRSIEKLPPIPPSFNSDSIQMGFNFHPGGEMR